MPDVLIRAGTYSFMPPLPAVPGQELVHTIENRCRGSPRDGPASAFTPAPASERLHRGGHNLCGTRRRLRQMRPFSCLIPSSQPTLKPHILRCRTAPSAHSLHLLLVRANPARLSQERASSRRQACGREHPPSSRSVQPPSISAQAVRLIIVVVTAPAGSADFRALGRRLVVLAHLALDCGDGFQFPWCVMPSAFDRCAFIEIKLLDVIGPDQVFPGGGACLP